MSLLHSPNIRAIFRQGDRLDENNSPPPSVSPTMGGKDTKTGAGVNVGTQVLLLEGKI